MGLRAGRALFTTWLFGRRSPAATGGDALPGHPARRGCRRYAVLALVILLASVAALVWLYTRPLDTTPPEAVLAEVEPHKPLFAAGEQQVTFVLRDDRGEIPTFYLFEDKEQEGTARGINTLRRTPNERGVEIRLEAIRFRRDATDPDTVWVRAVGIVNETEGKTPLSLAALERGDALDLHFHDEIEAPYIAHVTYDIFMTIQYEPRRQQLTITNASGSTRWQVLGSDAADEGRLETTLTGQKGHYPEKPLLELP